VSGRAKVCNLDLQTQVYRTVSLQHIHNQYHHGDLTVVSMTFISIFSPSGVVNRNENTGSLLDGKQNKNNNNNNNKNTSMQLSLHSLFKKLF